MADLRIRINELPEDTAPESSDFIPIDGPSTRKTTAKDLVAAAFPVATAIEANEGTRDDRAMTPLKTAEAIVSIGSDSFASSAQGNLADTAVQPSYMADYLDARINDAVSQGNVPIYSSATALASLEIPVGISFIRTNGYRSSGRGGGAKYRKKAPFELDVIGDQISNDGTVRWGLDETVLNVTMFGVVVGDPAYAISNVAAINQAETCAKAMGGMRLEYPSGIIYCHGTVEWWDSVEGVGLGGMPNIRVAPLSMEDHNSTPARMFDNLSGCELRFIGAGPRNLSLKHVTSSTQCGYGRANPKRPWNNEFDARFDLIDLTNKDADGATPATSKLFSAAVHLRTDTLNAPRRNNIRIITACDGIASDGGTSLEGYKVDNAFPAFADYDIGLYAQSPWQGHLLELNVVGYWKLLSFLMTTMREGDDQYAGYCEGNLLERCMFQGGTQIRSADSWPVLSKTATTITIPWTSSHQFDPSGTLRIGASFTNYSTFEYDGLTYDDAQKTLTLSIISGDVSAIADVASGTSTPHHITLSGGAGPALTAFHDCQLYDFSHTSLIPEPGLGMPYRPAFAVSGPVTRAIRLTGSTYLHPLGPLPLLLGYAADFQTADIYSEPRRWRVSFGGPLQERGGVVIAGPEPAKEQLCGTTYNGSMYSRGYWQHISINMAPLLRVSAGYYYSDFADGNFFNPRSYHPASEGMGRTSKNIFLEGLRGRDVGIAARRRDGSQMKGVTVRGDTGSVLLGRQTFPRVDEEGIIEQTEASRLILAGPDEPFSTLRSDFRLGDSYDPTVKTFQNDANGNLATQTDPKGPGFRFFRSLNQMRIASTDSAPLQLYRIGGSGRTAEFRTNGEVFGGIVQTVVGGNRTILELGPAGGVSISGGVGSPEGMITAPVGSIWLRTDAGPWSKFYTKEEGSGNTGWGS